MKTLITFLMILLASPAWSNEDPSIDFGDSDAEVKTLKRDELTYRFHVTGEIFILNKEGDRLTNIADESREWQYSGSSDQPLESNWRFQQKGFPLVALKQKWTLEKDGKITVEIAQYDNIERTSSKDIKYGKLIKEEKLTLKNFAPIDWPIPAGSQKLIVRLTPGVWPNSEAADISTLPMSGKNIVIYDRTGKLWADQVTPGRPSIYFGITTHGGSLFLSYKPFAGAKVIGEAKNGRIKIKNGKGGIFLQSEAPFLPPNVKANVYAVVKPDMKSDRLGSVRTYSSDSEEEFLKVFADK